MKYCIAPFNFLTYEKELFLGVTSLIMLASVTGFISYEQVNINDLLNANVDALAQNETQPDLSDCVYDENYQCIALHPTDPNKDQVKDNARW